MGEGARVREQNKNETRRASEDLLSRFQRVGPSFFLSKLARRVTVIALFKLIALTMLLGR